MHWARVYLYLPKQAGEISVYRIVLKIDNGGNFLAREHHFAVEIWEWFREKHPEKSRDVVFPESVSNPLIGVVFPGEGDQLQKLRLKMIRWVILPHDGRFYLIYPQNEWINR